MPAYHAPAQGVPPARAGQERLAPILVAFAGPAPQSRLTVLVRLLMVIPQFAVLWVLGIAAYVIVIIGWFGALSTGRLPAFAADFLVGYVRWQARVLGYTILLTDAYPPFTLEDADYPIRVVARPGRLNRLAVLCRLFLLIPAWIVQAVVLYGAFTIVQFVSWLIVLIAGQMPDALYQALAAVLRYQTRVLGFTFMLTSVYPAGLLGDLAAAAGYGPPPEPWAQPGYGQAGYGARPGGRQAGYGGRHAARAPGPPPGGASLSSWQLILSGGAKTLVVMFIVLGVLIAGGTGAIEAAAGTNIVTSAEAASQVQADFAPVNTAIKDYPAKEKACRGSLSCVTSLDRGMAAALGTLAGQVRGIPMPSAQASTTAGSLASSASDAASIFAALGGATTASQYQSIGSAHEASLRQAVDRMYSDYNDLGNQLTGS